MKSELEEIKTDLNNIKKQFHKYINESPLMDSTKFTESLSKTLNDVVVKHIKDSEMVKELQAIKIVTVVLAVLGIINLAMLLYLAE